MNARGPAVLSPQSLWRPVRAVMLALGLVLIPGCMTVVSQSAFWAGRAPDNMIDPETVIYAGFRNDLGAIGNLLCNDHAWTEERVQSSMWGVVLAVDLILSLAADTVILPIPVAEELYMRARREE